MTFFSPDVTTNHPQTGAGGPSFATRVKAGIASWRAARRQRAAEQAEVLRLRKLETYLPEDKLNEAGPLFTAVAHIAAAHEMLFFPNSPRRDISERPRDW